MNLKWDSVELKTWESCFFFRWVSHSTKGNPFYGTKFSSACEWKRDEIESLCKSSDIIFYPSLCDSIVTFNRRIVSANVFIVTVAHLLASEWVKRAACELETRSDPLLYILGESTNVWMDPAKAIRVRSCESLEPLKVTRGLLGHLTLFARTATWS